MELQSGNDCVCLSCLLFWLLVLPRIKSVSIFSVYKSADLGFSGGGGGGFLKNFQNFVDFSVRSSKLVF